MSSNLPLVSGPEWSPDGSRLLYTGSPTLTIFSSDIYVVMADGTGEVKLTDTPGVHESHAQWSPDGTKIVFVRWTSEPSTDIWVMNADGTGQMNLTADLAADFFPAWSPDGQAIAFSSDRTGDEEVYITRVDGSATLRMTNSPGADTRPRWRPRP
jgi:TolB protein